MSRAALLVLCLGASARAAEPAVQVIEQGEFLLSSEPSPPADAASGWTPVSLPDRWPESRPEASGPGWYRFSWTLERVPERRQAVYLDHVSMNAAVFVNSQWIGQGGRMEPPVAQNWNRPLSYAVPGGLLRAGENQVHVLVYRLPDCYGGLGPVRVGDADALAALEWPRLVFAVELPRAATILLVVVGLVMLGFWRGTGDAVYAGFASVAALHAVANLNYHVRDIPFSSRAWEALACAAVLLAAPAFALFAHRLAGWRRPRLERALYAFGAAALLLFAVPHAWFHPLLQGLGVVGLAISLYALLPVIAHARRDDPPLVALYLGSAALSLGLIGHDLAVQLGALPSPSSAWMPLVVPLLIATYVVGLTRRFVRVFRAAESVRAHEQDVASERERIMREMHDGLGSRLVRTLAMVERDGVSAAELGEAIRATLDDMRLVIDSLDPGIDDVALLLGTLRERLEPRVARGGVRFEWAVEELSPAPRLGAEQSLDLLRILEEAIANVLRHAKASAILVAARLDPGGVSIEVRDDGVGIAADARLGRGLANMAFRARRLGAEVSVEPAQPGPGTRVLLRLPARDVSERI